MPIKHVCKLVFVPTFFKFNLKFAQSNSYDAKKLQLKKYTNQPPQIHQSWHDWCLHSRIQVASYLKLKNDD